MIAWSTALRMLAAVTVDDPTATAGAFLGVVDQPDGAILVRAQVAGQNAAGEGVMAHADGRLAPALVASSLGPSAQDQFDPQAASQLAVETLRHAFAQRAQAAQSQIVVVKG